MLLAMFGLQTSWAMAAWAQGVEWQILEGEQILITSLNTPRIYRICLHAQMHEMDTTFEPRVRTLSGAFELKLPRAPNRSRCLDIEAKRIEIFGGDKVVDPKRIAFGTYELVQ